MGLCSFHSLTCCYTLTTRTGSGWLCCAESGTQTIQFSPGKHVTASVEQELSAGEREAVMAVEQPGVIALLTGAV